MNSSGHGVTFDESDELESIEATAIDGDHEMVVRQNEVDRTHHQWVIDRCNGESKFADYHPPIVRIQLQPSPDPGDEEDGTNNDGRRHISCNDDEAQRIIIACGAVNGVVATTVMEKFDGGEGPSTPAGLDEDVSGEIPVPVPVANGASSREGNGFGFGGADSGDVSSTAGERTPPREGDDFDACGLTKPVHLEGESAATSHDAESGDFSYRTKTGEKPRRWLIDRCDGVSKSPSGFGSGTNGGEEESRPPK